MWAARAGPALRANVLPISKVSVALRYQPAGGP